MAQEKWMPVIKCKPQSQAYRAGWDVIFGHQVTKEISPEELKKMYPQKVSEECAEKLRNIMAPPWKTKKGKVGAKFNPKEFPRILATKPQVIENS